MNDSVAGSRHQDQARSVDPLKIKSKARLRTEVDPENSGQSHKAIAIDLRTSEAQLTRFMGDQYGDDLPAHKVPHLTRSVGPGYMQWLALQCGGVYHHGEQHPQHHESVTVLIGLLAKASGDTIQQLVQALEDQDWSKTERKANLPGLRRLHGIVGALLQDAEGGAE